MRIGMILDESFPPDPRVNNESKTLIKAGYEVFLFCLDFNKGWKKNEVINGLNISRYRIPKLIFKLSALAYSVPFYHIWMFLPIYRFIRRNSIDILHVHDIRIYRTIRWISKFLKIRVVLDLHENRPEIMNYYKHVNEFPGKYLISTRRWKKFEFKSIEQSDKVIVVTKNAKDFYINNIDNLDPFKIYVVPNSVNQSFYHNPIINKDIVKRFKNSFNLIYIGDTSKRRGLLVVLDAMAVIKGIYPNIKLIILGKSSADQLIKDRIHTLNLKDHVFMEGWVSSELFASYIKTSKIGLSPILRNIHHDTTYANKIFQYMALGLPVIVSDCDAQKELVNEYCCGYVYSAEDHKELTARIIELYENDELRTQFGGNAVTSIEQHLNWDVLSSSLVRVYKEI